MYLSHILLVVQYPAVTHQVKNTYVPSEIKPKKSVSKRKSESAQIAFTVHVLFLASKHFNIGLCI